MTKKTTESPVVSPLLDAYGNPALVAPGELIESAWGNSVAGRVVLRVPDQTALNGVSAAEGTLAVTTAGHVVYMRSGGVWVPTGAGNTIMFRLLGGTGGQQIPRVTKTACTWKTEDYDANNVVGDLTHLTVPAGWAGRWHFEWSVDFPPAGPGSRRAALWVSSTGRNYGLSGFEAEGSEWPSFCTGSATVVLPAGATVHVEVHQSSMDANFFINTTPDQYFQGHYQGPV